MTTLTFDAILEWPKAELHCHLDGSVRPQTLLDLATDQGKRSLLPSDSAEGLEQALLQIDESTTLEAYLSWFDYTIEILQSASALRLYGMTTSPDSTTSMRTTH